jgi:hypothetical protein
MRALGLTLGLMAGAGLALAGCARPQVDLLAAGAGPDRAANGYRLAEPADPDAAGDKLILPLVEARLDAKGFKRLDAGAPRYVLEVAYSGRPIAVGAFAGAAPTAKGAQPDWLSAPGKRRWWQSRRQGVCQVALRFVDIKTGQEAYKVRAALRGSMPDCAPVAPRLVDTALANVPAPAGETHVR